MKYKLIFLSFALFSVLSYCDRDNRFVFPYIPVNLYLGLQSDLGGLGYGEVMFNDPAGNLSRSGVKGIIIYKSEMLDDNGNDIFMAFDRACTYEPDHSCAVDTLGAFRGVVKCPCCKSEYLLLTEGDILKGPASHPLVRYKTFIDGGFLRIVN